ncbi:hypothetical protein Nepgr_029804 [Nepenthes gracilis]|uniref:Uncharacterized protein n=1 Tax=Nepenthes gracilis TaxID=150966 RepID=A0AAD3Y5X1_NEPGR|nr:hypothetical protein Nepgr_029804 [Nepenthes gracilis]
MSSQGSSPTVIHPLNLLNKRSKVDKHRPISFAPPKDPVAWNLDTLCLYLYLHQSGGNLQWRQRSDRLRPEELDAPSIQSECDEGPSSLMATSTPRHASHSRPPGPSPWEETPRKELAKSTIRKGKKINGAPTVIRDLDPGKFSIHRVA